MIRAALPRVLAAALMLAGAGVAIAAAGDDRDDNGRPQVAVLRAERPLRIDNSGHGRAVVSAGNIAPGDTRRGDVTLRVSRPARMSLLVDRLDDVPGPFGGRLADALSLRIKTIGGGTGRWRNVYEGPLAGRGRHRLGRWHPGERHRFRVRVRLPALATTQDSVQGARTSFRLLWRAGR